MRNLSWNVVRALVALSACAALAGCKSDSKATGVDGGGGDFKPYCDLPKPCQEIAQACHPKDDGSPGKIHDCHETGHDVGTLAACSAVHDDCLTTCNSAPALSDGPVEDLGAACHDAGHS